MRKERGFRWHELKRFLVDHGVVIDDDAEHIVIDCRMGLFDRVYAGKDISPKLIHPRGPTDAPKTMRL